jgi:hypothetical protein
MARNRKTITPLTSSMIERNDDMETKRFSGFSRKDHSKNFIVVLDVPKAHSPTPFTPFKAAEDIAGPDICFFTSMNILTAVPENIKGRLLPIAEYFAAMPEGPDYRRPRTRKFKLTPRSSVTPLRWR